MTNTSSMTYLNSSRWNHKYIPLNTDSSFHPIHRMPWSVPKKQRRNLVDGPEVHCVVPYWKRMVVRPRQLVPSWSIGPSTLKVITKVTKISNLPLCCSQLMSIQHRKYTRKQTKVKDRRRSRLSRPSPQIKIKVYHGMTLTLIPSFWNRMMRGGPLNAIVVNEMPKRFRTKCFWKSNNCSNCLGYHILLPLPRQNHNVSRWNVWVWWAGLSPTTVTHLFLVGKKFIKIFSTNKCIPSCTTAMTPNEKWDSIRIPW